MSEYENEYRIAQLLAKEKVGSLTSEEEQELKEWKNSSSNAMSVYERVSDPENKRRRDEFMHGLDTREAWLKVEKRCLSLLRVRRMKYLVRWTGVAAVLLLAVLIGVRYYPEREIVGSVGQKVAGIQAGTAKAILISEVGVRINLFETKTKDVLDLGNGLKAIRRGNVVEYLEDQDTAKKSDKLNVIRIPKGGEYELILPDGTHVWINSDSELSFPSKFGSSKREVLLAGEAYFAVTKNEEAPFIVKMVGDVQVKVLGTEFNIRAYPDAGMVETTLCQGSVRVSDGNSDVTLNPSEQVVYNKEKKEWKTRIVNTRLYTAWKEGMFFFQNERLEDILTTLARWYNVNVFYKNSSVKDYHFTGKLERYSDFEVALRMIEKTTAIRFVVEGRKVIVEELADRESDL